MKRATCRLGRWQPGQKQTPDTEQTNRGNERRGKRLPDCDDQLLHFRQKDYEWDHQEKWRGRDREAGYVIRGSGERASGGMLAVRGL